MCEFYIRPNEVHVIYWTLSILTPVKMKNFFFLDSEDKYTVISYTITYYI